jgi:hypothetical protein
VLETLGSELNEAKAVLAADPNVHMERVKGKDRCSLTALVKLDEPPSGTAEAGWLISGPATGPSRLPIST